MHILLVIWSFELERILTKKTPQKFNNSYKIITVSYSLKLNLKICLRVGTQMRSPRQKFRHNDRRPNEVFILSGFTSALQWLCNIQNSWSSHFLRRLFSFSTSNCEETRLEGSGVRLKEWNLTELRCRKSTFKIFANLRAVCANVLMPLHLVVKSTQIFQYSVCAESGAAFRFWLVLSCVRFILIYMVSSQYT